jgi:formimidoylglutamase
MPVADPYWPRADAWLAMEASDPDLVVVGVPTSKASLTPSRADLTPLALRDRLSRFSTFHGEWGVDLAGVRVRDMGNWAVSELDMHQMPAEVHDLAHDLPPAELVIYLGGDNAITRPLVTALNHGLDAVGVITFDAHHDVRSLDSGPTNGTPIRGLIEEDGLPGENVCQVGIHSFSNSRPYREWCEEMGIAIETMAAVEEDGIHQVMERVLARLAHCETIYVDVDVDVLDRHLAPACPGSRPGGMGIRALAEGVRIAAADPRVRALDFVEVDAEADVGALTLDNTAHLMLSAVAGFATR